MQSDRRRLWPSILLMALIAPFVALMVLSYSAPLPGGEGAPSSVAPAPSPPLISPAPSGVASASAPATAPGTGPVSIVGTSDVSRPPNALFAAGDGRSVWIAHGFRNDSGIPGFQLLWRPANSNTWRLSQHQVAGGPMGGGDLQDFWTDQGMPRELVLMKPAGDPGDPSTPVVIGERGYVDRYYADHNAPLSDLPRDAVLRAATGGPGEMFAVMQGAAPVIHPGESLHGSPAASPAKPATVPASMPATSTAPASAPGGLRPVVAKTPELLSTYWFPPPASRPAPAATAPAASAPAAKSEDLLTPRPGDWTLLDPLATEGADGKSAPGPASQLALAARGDQLIAVWADPKLQDTLRVRTLDFKRKNAHWSDAVVSELPHGEGVPAVSRLMTVAIGDTVYVLWTVPTGASIALHGGWLETNPQAAPTDRYRLSPAHMVRPMSLDSAGQGISPATDVAAAASANSFLIVAQQSDKPLTWLLFDNHGGLLSGPAPVELHVVRPDNQIGQNAIVIVLGLMIALSFMQWRRKVEPLALPSGTVIAPLALRLGAMGIDLLVSYIVVLIAFSAWENGGYIGLAESWILGSGRPEDLFTSPEFLVFAGVYLAQVTLGEMFFRRSIGKAVTGLQVLMLDGKSPTVAAILVRNLLRLPECVLAIGLLFAAFSDRRQRLGDALARTVVVSQPGPEMPKDPDKEK